MQLVLRGPTIRWHQARQAGSSIVSHQLKSSVQRGRLVCVQVCVLPGDKIVGQPQLHRVPVNVGRHEQQTLLGAKGCQVGRQNLAHAALWANLRPHRHGDRQHHAQQEPLHGYRPPGCHTCGWRQVSVKELHWKRSRRRHLWALDCVEVRNQDLHDQNRLDEPREVTGLLLKHPNVFLFHSLTHTDTHAGASYN